MNVLLLHPPLTRSSYLSRFQVHEPLAHIHIGAALGRRHRVKFVDLRFSSDLERELDGFRPNVALVGTSPLTFARVGPILDELKDRFDGISILLFPNLEYGSSHVAERPWSFAHPLAEAVVPHEFVVTLRRVFTDVLDALERGTGIGGIPGLYLKDPSGRWSFTKGVAAREEAIGIPDRGLLGRHRGRYRFAGIRGMANLFYTYGCRYKCEFCPMSKHDGTIVRRPISEVVTELEAMSEGRVFLMDFEPFLLPGAMEELADAVEKAGIEKSFYMLIRADSALENLELLARWRKLGLDWIFVGLDGHSKHRLDTMRKGSTVDVNERAIRALEKIGFGVSVGFLIPSGFNRDDFRELHAYVRRLRPQIVDFTVETPLVGTRLFDREEGRVTTTDWSLFDLHHAVLPTVLPLPEFYREMTKLHLWAGRHNVVPMLKHYGWKETLLNFPLGIAAFRSSLLAARDHDGIPGASPVVARQRRLPPRRARARL